jgi:hypothetical protein
MHNLAQTVKAQGDLARARQLQEQVLEASRRSLGVEHPNTLTAMGNLAGTVYAQGDLAGARELEEQVLEGRRRLLGAEHSDTSTAAWNFFRTLLDSGDPDGAATVIRDYLYPLSTKDPARLSADQRNILAMLADLVRGQSAG